MVTMARERSDMPAALAGGLGMTFVGGSVAVSGIVTPNVMYAAGAVRYAIACLLLIGYARVTGLELRRPRGTEWLWLTGVAALGLVLFNVALVEGSRHAEPAVLGVAVACVPPVLAVAGPFLQRVRPARNVLIAGLVVTAGAIMVTGMGRSDAVGIGYALVVFACESAFTLLAVPVLKRHGPCGVSVHTGWMASVMFVILAVAREGTGVRLTTDQWLAVCYLAVCVTAMAFVLWFSCVNRLGPGRAGLLAGITPVSAAVVGVGLGGAIPGPAVWLGVGVVAAGLATGLRSRRFVMVGEELDDDAGGDSKSGLCLDDPNGVTTDGTKLRI
jgi:drug/metabolite transporter (DMT)-like permease